MNNFSAKNKIYLAVAAWVVLCGIVFGYLFDILDGQNSGQVNKIRDLRKQLVQLQAEQESYVQAQRDLEAVKQKTYQPADFFSKDVTLVKEIRTLEALGEKAGVDFKLSGLSGTVSTAQKAKANGQIFIIPASFSIAGSFQNVVEFLQYMEHLDFAVNVSSMSLGVANAGVLNVSLVGNLYISK